MSSLKIQEMPEQDRPREKLARLGSAALSDSELIAILLRVGVRVRDSNQQEAVLDHSLLIDVPAEVFQKVLDERNRQYQARIQQRQQPIAQRAAPATNPADIAALSKRVRELELENERLRAQVELLKEIQRNGPATRPSK